MRYKRLQGGSDGYSVPAKRHQYDDQGGVVSVVKATKSAILANANRIRDLWVEAHGYDGGPR